MNIKAQEWVVDPFLHNFWCDFCLNNEGTEVQHKAGVNTRNGSRNSQGSGNSWENRRCECTLRQERHAGHMWNDNLVSSFFKFTIFAEFLNFCLNSLQYSLFARHWHFASSLMNMSLFGNQKLKKSSIALPYISLFQEKKNSNVVS